MVRKNVDCRQIRAVAAVVEHQQAAEYVPWALAEGSEFLSPGVLEGGEKGNLALMAAQMSTNVATHLRAAGMDDKWYAMHSVRVGGAAGHTMDGMATDVLMKSSGGSPQPSHADT